MKTLTEEQRLVRNAKGKEQQQRARAAAKAAGRKRQRSTEEKLRQAQQSQRERDALKADRVRRGVKFCSKCGEERPQAEFSPKFKRPICHGCAKASIETRQALQNARLSALPHAVLRTRNSKRNLAYRAQKLRQPEIIQQRSEGYIQRKFGVTIGDVNAMFAQQGGVCVGCLSPIHLERTGQGRTGACIDHCHYSGKPRGLLCSMCNKALGAAKDSVRVLENLAAYLRVCPSLGGVEHVHEFPYYSVGIGSISKNTERQGEAIMAGESLSKEQIYARMAAASASSTGINLLDGRGRLAIKKFNVDSGFNGSRVVVDAIICSSQKIHVQDIVTHQVLDITPNPPGSEVNLVYMVGKHVAAFGALKSLVLAVYDEKAEDNTDEQLINCMRTLCEQNDAYGRVVNYVTVRKLTVERKVQMVNPKWEAVKQTAEDVAAMQKWLNSLSVTPA